MSNKCVCGAVGELSFASLETGLQQAFETIKILPEEWFSVYGAPKEVSSDGDVRVRSDTGSYKRESLLFAKMDLSLGVLGVLPTLGSPTKHTITEPKLTL